MRLLDTLLRTSTSVFNVSLFFICLDIRPYILRFPVITLDGNRHKIMLMHLTYSALEINDKKIVSFSNQVMLRQASSTKP